MNLIKSLTSGNKDQTQTILLFVSSIFLFIYSLILTLAPAVRYHSWDVTYNWKHWIGYLAWLIIVFLINKISIQKFQNRDPYLLPMVFLLLGWGLLTIFRLNPAFGWRQTAWMAISAAVMALGIYKQNFLFSIRRYKYVWLTLGLILTALTFFFGIYPNGEGPRLWLGCCGFYIQPSEPLKLLFIIYLAAYLADIWPNRHNLPALIIPTSVYMGAALLILVAQRDLGTASIFIMIYAFFMFLATGKRRTLILFIVVLIVAGFVGFRMFDVIQFRIEAWINPWLDPLDKSYQIIQSLQAIAAGKFVGSGPGVGSPGLIPVALSDFIFSAITEETGLLGATALLTIYAFITFRGFTIALKASNQYHRLLAAGLTLMIAAQTILIIGGNTRLLPLTGVTLPLFSYGGSSLISTMVAVLLLLWISQQPTSRTISTTESKTYLFSFNALLAGFIGLILLTGWWSVVRSDTLLNRTDNFRKIINDRFVERGAILDRNNEPIAVTTGTPGNYNRTVLEPNLSFVVGYNNPTFGQSGLEASMDPYLRGVEGLPSSVIWINELLYSQPPEGLDIRTSIDLSIQRDVDSAFSSQQGAAIVMNANTGEILALWSAPSFNANQLNEQWQTWLNSANAPLLNRATQGSYSPGSLLTPFIYAYILENEPNFSIEPTQLDATTNSCAIPIEDSSLNEMMMNGCDKTFDLMIDKMLDAQVDEFITDHHWDSSYEFVLPQNTPTSLEEINTNQQLKDQLSLSPLQIAISAAAFTQNGISPSPRIAMAVNTPQQGWLVFANQDQFQIMPGNIAEKISQDMSRIDFPAWEITANPVSGQGQVSWYLSGTLSSWKGTPVILTVVLENSEPQIVRKIGQQLMEQITAGTSQ